MIFNQHWAYISLPEVITHANELKTSEVTEPKITEFLAVAIFFIDNVNATIRVAIRPPAVEWEGQKKSHKQNISPPNKIEIHYYLEDALRRLSVDVVPLPPWRPAVTLTFYPQNLIGSSVGQYIHT